MKQFRAPALLCSECRHSVDFARRVWYNSIVIRRIVCLKMQRGGLARSMKELHGMQGGSSPMRRRKQPRRFSAKRRCRIGWCRILPLILLIALFLYAAVHLAQYAIRAVSTKRTNGELQAMYAPEPEASAALASVP